MACIFTHYFSIFSDLVMWYIYLRFLFGKFILMELLTNSPDFLHLKKCKCHTLHCKLLRYIDVITKLKENFFFCKFNPFILVPSGFFCLNSQDQTISKRSCI